MGAHARVGIYSEAAESIIRTNFLLLLEAGQYVLERISLDKPERAEKTMKSQLRTRIKSRLSTEKQMIFIKICQTDISLSRITPSGSRMGLIPKSILDGGLFEDLR